MTHKLDPARLPELLATLPRWTLNGTADAISRHLEFPDFAEAFAFMTRIAFTAQARDHHPDWTNRFNVVDITLSTHSAKGLTMKDIEMARLIDRVATAASH